jgi:integrase
MPENRVIVWVQNRGDRDKLSLEWHDPVTGRRKSKSAGTCNPLEAEKRRADLEYELNHGLHRDTSGMSWERFRELFEEEYVCHLRPRSKQNYSDALDSFEELCRPTSLRGVSVRTLSAFLAAMGRRPTRGREGMSPGTMKVRLQFLRTALRWAVTQKLIPECPTFPAVKVPRKKPQPVPLESFERLLDKTPDPQMKGYLLCGWLAGLRLAEALALEWEPTEEAPYLDLARDRIILPAGFVKSVEDQWIPLDPQLREALEALLRRGKRVFHFADPRTGKPASAHAMCDRIRDLAKAAGVRLSMKSLRKGFGCRYAGRVSAHVLQRLMRHASIKTTMDYYANIDDAVEEAVLGRREDRGSSLRVISRVSGPIVAPEGHPTGDEKQPPAEPQKC